MEGQLFSRYMLVWPCALVLLVSGILSGSCSAADKSLPSQSQKLISSNDIVGEWHYRSFANENKTVPDLNSILFGEGEFALDESVTGVLSGVGDFGGGDTVKFEGTVSHGGWITIRFRAIGTGPTNKDWLYDYVCVLVPQWPNGVNQAQALVGSVVRSAPHSNGSNGIAPAGRVASFIAIKK